MNVNQIIQAIKTVVPRKSTLPILDCILLDGKFIISTNLEESVFIPYESERTVINSREFCAVLKSYGEHFQLHVQRASKQNPLSVIVTFKGERLVLAGENPDEFPSVSRTTGEYMTAIESQDLEAITRAVAFVSKDELRRATMYILWREHIVATDSHRLFWQKAVRPSAKPLLLSPKTIKLLNIFGGDWNVSLRKDTIVFVSSDLYITQKLPEEKFPDYRTVIPIRCNRILTIPRKKFIESVVRASRYAPVQTNLVQLSLNASNKILAQDEDIGKKFSTQINGVFKGQPLEIGFDAKMLLSIIEDRDTELVKITFGESNTAAVIDDHYLLMPRRIGK